MERYNITKYLDPINNSTMYMINNIIQLQKIFQKYNIQGLCFDSRESKKGDAFFAIKGENYDGNKFINIALNKGSSLIITDDIRSFSYWNNSNKDKVIYVSNARISLSQASSIFYPKMPRNIVVATGTNGKTSVTSYCRQLYSLLGVGSVNIGTMGIEYSDNIQLDNIINKTLLKTMSLTTLDPISLRYILHNLAENNINYVSFEASSHGLAQERLHGIKASAACFTSFSQDHLDYHQNMDNYLQSKLKLFTDNLLPTGIAILNSGIQQLDYIKSYLQEHNVQFIDVGLHGCVKITKILQSIYKQNVNFIFKNKEYSFSTNIMGYFQITNLLIAAILVHNTGFVFEDIISKLSYVKSVRGRLERITNHNSPYHIFIDYAHTPHALENILTECKKFLSNNGKLKLIFGCGGDRDKSKRSLMGEVAIRIADQVIITDDNPRNEDPAMIRYEIIKPISSSNKYIEIADRKKAIINVINDIQKDDILLIAGKGHEAYQIIGNKTITFSDIDIAKEVILNRKL